MLKLHSAEGDTVNHDAIAGGGACRLDQWGRLLVKQQIVTIQRNIVHINLSARM